MFFQDMGQTALLGNEGSFDLAYGTTSAVPGDPSEVSGMSYRKTFQGQTCFKDTLEQEAQFYRFTVRARNACGAGPWSDVETAFVPREDPCSDPTKPCSHRVIDHTHQASAEFGPP